MRTPRTRELLSGKKHPFNQVAAFGIRQIPEFHRADSIFNRFNIPAKFRIRFGCLPIGVNVFAH